MGYPTPNNLPSEVVCRQIFIPDDPRWLAVYNGLLSYLAQSFAWEMIGSLTPDECAAKAAEIYYQFLEGCGSAPVTERIGAIVMCIDAEVPFHYLQPGGAYSISQFPILASLMPPELVFPLDDLFAIPELTGNVLMIGNGNGYGSGYGNMFVDPTLGAAAFEYNTGASFMNLWVVGDPQ